MEGIKRQEAGVPPSCLLGFWSSVVDGVGASLTRDFKLRGIVQSSSTYTRDAEPEQITLNNLHVLAKGGKIAIDGLRTGEDPTDWIYIYAWSDPDGDGIYVQHMFDVSKNDPITTSLDEGPFELISHDGASKHVHFPYYFLHGLYGTPEDAPSSIEVSTEFLTELFGTNTIVELEIFTQGYFEGEFGTKARCPGR